MDEDARLARLRGFSGATDPQGNSSSNTALQGRLDALSGGSARAGGSEEGFNNRLASLLLSAEGDNKSPCAEDLSTRLSRLSTRSTGGVGVASATPVKQPRQAYGVPEDFSDEWQDLNDLLEAAVDGEGSASLAFNGDASVAGESNVDEKLSEIDALLKAEAARGALDGSSSSSSSAPGGSAAARAEEAGVEVNKATEAFLEGAGGARRGEEQLLRREELGEQDERLLQMVTDQVRLEGHGVTDRASTPVQQDPSGEMWLPLAPTGRPNVSRGGGAGGGMARHHPVGNIADLDAGAAARLIAQQAMDEARLGLSSSTSEREETPSLLSGKGGGNGNHHQQQQQKNQASSSWCCICSEDAALRCEQCEAENNGQEGEPELFCARCFKEVHRGDPEMKAHRPRAVGSRRGAAAGGEEDGGRK